MGKMFTANFEREMLFLDGAGVFFFNCFYWAIINRKIRELVSTILEFNFDDVFAHLTGIPVPDWCVSPMPNYFPGSGGQISNKGRESSNSNHKQKNNIGGLGRDASGSNLKVPNTAGISFQFLFFLC